MNVLLSLPAVTIRYPSCLHLRSLPELNCLCSVIASSLTLFAFDDYNGKDASPRSRSGTGSRPSELVSAPLPGNLTTHISMDMGYVSRSLLSSDAFMRDIR